MSKWHIVGNLMPRLKVILLIKLTTFVYVIPQKAWAQLRLNSVRLKTGQILQCLLVFYIKTTAYTFLSVAQAT